MDKKKKKPSIISMLLHWFWHLGAEEQTIRYSPLKKAPKRPKDASPKPVQQSPIETDDLYERIRAGQVRGEALNELYKRGKIKFR